MATTIARMTKNELRELFGDVPSRIGVVVEMRRRKKDR